MESLKVNELISLLNKYPKKAKVYLETYNGGVQLVEKIYYSDDQVLIEDEECKQSLSVAEVVSELRRQPVDTIVLSNYPIGTIPINMVVFSGEGDVLLVDSRLYSVRFKLYKIWESDRKEKGIKY